MTIDRQKLRTLCSITVEAEPENEHPGGFFSSGDDAADARTVATILEKWRSGDVWAWCWVKVTVEYAGESASDSLGACSYDSEADFRRPGGYYDDMVDVAVEELARRFEGLGAALDAITTGLLL